MTKIGGHSDGATADGISRVPASGPHTETPVPAGNEPWFAASIRLWWVGRILAVAKWMQRTSFLLNASANRLLDDIKDGR